MTGRRADGYHLLDSLVVFAGVADAVGATPATDWSLAVNGPEAAGLACEDDNLVLRAARLLANAAGRPAGAALALTKRLPVASGIGGGSADAAAALRALNALWNIRFDEARLAGLAAGLGADVPACIVSRPCRMAGVGDVLSAAPRLPAFGLLLANPRVALSTPAVFAARRAGFSAAAVLPEAWPDAASMALDLAALRNDLEHAAAGLCPAIPEVLGVLRTLPGCLLARMSGSGATCFGLFRTPAEAAAAARTLPAEWWCWGGGVHQPAG